MPLLVRGPGIQPGTTIDLISANIDIAPTIIELAGAQTDAFVDGRSFAQFISGPAQPTNTDWRKALLIETGSLERESPVIAYRGVRTENYIYIEYENGELEFYDLVVDPYQMDNIASQLSEKTLSILHTWLGELKLCQAEECRQIEMNIPAGIDY